ncbi:MAG: IS256 family transposase [Planctomycetes bacterium]|nr:IS256 family transposase [Planctomycetota bacterium]
MKKKTTPEAPAASVTWETLESFAREQIQLVIQRVLDEEVTSLLGRVKSARRSPVDGEVGYRNGHGKPRRLSLTCGTVTVRRPRVRGLEERFESRILPLFARRTEEIGGLLPELYLHGLSQGDFELALRGLLGDAAPLSASSIERLRGKWQAEFEEWRTRPVNPDVVYLWVDGIYVKAGLEKEKACLLVAIAGLRDGRKVVVAIESGYRESTESWAGLLRALRERGMNAPRLVIGDGHLGIWSALAAVFPEAEAGRCWNHKILNVLEELPKKLRPQAQELLRQIPAAETQAECEKLRDRFVRRYQGGYPKAAAALLRDWERMVTFYRFPQEHWRHLRTSNVVESPFASVRLRTAAGKRYKKVASATALIWKVLMIAESRFRRLNAAHLLGEVAEGAKYEDGVRVHHVNRRAAA